MDFSLDVLCVISLGVAAFSAGRLLISGDVPKQDLGASLLVLTMVAEAVYLTRQEGWPGFAYTLVVLATVACYVAGFMGKDSLKTPLRKHVRPRLQEAAGKWDTSTDGQDDIEVV